MNFRRLSENITVIDQSLRRAAVGSVSRFTTMRNWLIGRHIVEYEQHGNDRAKYGESVLPRLALELAKENTRGFSPRNLHLFREFHRRYPYLAEAVDSELRQLPGVLPPALAKIWQKPSAKLAAAKITILQKPSAKLQSIDNKKVATILLSPEPDKLLRFFSFSHFVELMRLDDPLKRAFYEIEGIKGNWSVPQLKRQIESLLYERTGLSKSPAAVVDRARTMNVAASVDDMIRDPYILEFAGLPERYEYSEDDLETALLNHVQEFLLELGNGFCFEARQKRITLDNEHDRIDLVFYHRLLRCHVLIDLKARKFRHADAGQMNFYLNYYRDNMMAVGDNPPVGLVLCTHRDETVVKYATTGLDNKLFVSKYLTALPSEERLLEFLRDDRERTEHHLQETLARYEGQTI